MPLVQADDPSVWSDWYKIPMPDGTVAGFERRAKDLIIGQDQWKLYNALNITENQTVVFIGAAYGWIAEDWFNSNKISSFLCLDTSSLIEEHKAQNATVPIYNIDILDQNGVDQVLSLMGGKADWVISEDVLPCLSDTECSYLNSQMKLVGISVAHWVSIGVPPPMNNKSIEDWKIILTDSFIIPRGSDKVY